MAQTNVQAFSGDVEISSNLAVDTNTLFVDSVGNNVGIGTTNPGTPLHILSTNEITTSPASSSVSQLRYGTANSTMLFGVSSTAGHISAYDTSNFSTNRKLCLNADGGNVGIGTTDPQQILHLQTDTNYDGITLRDSTRELLKIAKGDNGSYINMFESSVSKVNISTGGDTYFTGGDVGIGTTTPNQKLHVNGNAQINNLVIKSGSGNYTTSGAYTGINMNAGNGGGLVIMMVSHQNNSGDNTGMFVHVLKRPYSGATSLYPYSPGAIQLVNSSQGTAAGKSITYYTDTGAVLKFNFNYTTNYKWAAIEL